MDRKSLIIGLTIGVLIGGGFWVLPRSNTASLETQISAVESQLEKTNSEISRLQNLNSSQQEQIDNLESDLETSTSELEELLNDYDFLKTEYDRLKIKYDNFNVSYYENTVSKLEKRLSNFQINHNVHTEEWSHTTTTIRGTVVGVNARIFDSINFPTNKVRISWILRRTPSLY